MTLRLHTQSANQDKNSDYQTSWRQEVIIAMGIYLPLIPTLLSDLILVATKLLTDTGNLLQSLTQREGGDKLETVYR